MKKKIRVLTLLAALASLPGQARDLLSCDLTFGFGGACHRQLVVRADAQGRLDYRYAQGGQDRADFCPPEVDRRGFLVATRIDQFSENNGVQIYRHADGSVVLATRPDAAEIFRAGSCRSSARSFTARGEGFVIGNVSEREASKREAHGKMVAAAAAQCPRGQLLSTERVNVSLQAYRGIAEGEFYCLE